MKPLRIIFLCLLVYVIKVKGTLLDNLNKGSVLKQIKHNIKEQLRREKGRDLNPIFNTDYDPIFNNNYYTKDYLSKNSKALDDLDQGSVLKQIKNNIKEQLRREKERDLNPIFKSDYDPIFKSNYDTKDHLKDSKAVLVRSIVPHNLKLNSDYYNKIKDVYKPLFRLPIDKNKLRNENNKKLVIVLKRNKNKDDDKYSFDREFEDERIEKKNRDERVQKKVRDERVQKKVRDERVQKKERVHKKERLTSNDLLLQPFRLYADVEDENNNGFVDNDREVNNHEFVDDRESNKEKNTSQQLKKLLNKIIDVKIDRNGEHVKSEELDAEGNAVSKKKRKEIPNWLPKYSIWNYWTYVQSMYQDNCKGDRVWNGEACIRKS